MIQNRNLQLLLNWFRYNFPNNIHNLNHNHHNQSNDKQVINIKNFLFTASIVLILLCFFFLCFFFVNSCCNFVPPEFPIRYVEMFHGVNINIIYKCSNQTVSILDVSSNSPLNKFSL